jgi:tetratricopeptide (TPR) repeat protein
MELDYAAPAVGSGSGFRVFRRATAMRLAGFAAFALFGFLTYWSLRLAYADRLFHLNTWEGLEHAARLIPWNPEYQRRWGMADPVDGFPHLENAVRLNPRDSAAWIRIGLRAEMQGDFQKAEKAFLRAVEADRTFEPRWTLASYYSRRDDRPKFWFWVEKAAEMNYGDPTALFRLCDRMTGSAAEILDRAIPEHGPLLGQYLAFLLDAQRLDAAANAAGRLAGRSGTGDAPLLLAACESLLQAGNAPAAASIWNTLSASKSIAAPAVREDAVVNGGFATAPLGHGFDWRLNPVEGIDAHPDPPSGLRISFSGKQPEWCEILSQFVRVTPGRQYVLRFASRTSDIPAASGIRWRVHAPQLAAESSVPAAGTLPFTVPAGVNLIRLALTYARAPGTMRIEGTIWIGSVSLQACREERFARRSQRGKERKANHFSWRSLPLCDLRAKRIVAANRSARRPD